MMYGCGCVVVMEDIQVFGVDLWLVCVYQVGEVMVGVVGYCLFEGVVVGVEEQVVVRCGVDYWGVIGCGWVQVGLEFGVVQIVVFWVQVMYDFFKGGVVVW